MRCFLNPRGFLVGKPRAFWKQRAWTGDNSETTAISARHHWVLNFRFNV